MTIHVLVEGPSERAFLVPWATRLLREVPIRIHPHQGKGELPADLDAKPDRLRRGLLDQLPAKLRGFAASLDLVTDRVVVLVDADEEKDPGELERRISAAARRISPGLRVLVRLAVEELEAFYLGDLRALERAFPEADMRRARAYAPDSICGTWELFGKIVRDGGGNKVAWAEAMGPRLTTRAERNRSPSFKRFVTGLVEILPRPPARKKKPARRHTPKPHKNPSRRR